MILLNANINKYEKGAEIWQSIKLQKPKSKQIQRSLVESYKLMAIGIRDYTKNVKFNPETNKIETPTYSPKSLSSIGAAKIREATDELVKYCPHTFKPVFNQLGMLKNPEKLPQKS